MLPFLHLNITSFHSNERRQKNCSKLVRSVFVLYESNANENFTRTSHCICYFNCIFMWWTAHKLFLILLLLLVVSSSNDWNYWIWLAIQFICQTEFSMHPSMWINWTAPFSICTAQRTQKIYQQQQWWQSIFHVFTMVCETAYNSIWNIRTTLEGEKNVCKKERIGEWKKQQELVNEWRRVRAKISHCPHNWEVYEERYLVWIHGHSENCILWLKCFTMKCTDYNNGGSSRPNRTTRQI